MTTLEAIIAELRRQRRDGEPLHLDLDDPTCATIDGDVDLVAVAQAIDKARCGQHVVAGASEPEGQTSR